MLNCCGHNGVYHRFEPFWPGRHFVLDIPGKYLYVPGMQWPCWLSAQNPIWWPTTSETKSLGTSLMCFRFWLRWTHQNRSLTEDASYKSPKREMVDRWQCSFQVFVFMFSNVSVFSRWRRNINVGFPVTIESYHIYALHVVLLARHQSSLQP